MERLDKKIEIMFEDIYWQRVKSSGCQVSSVHVLVLVWWPTFIYFSVAVISSKPSQSAMIHHLNEPAYSIAFALHIWSLPKQFISCWKISFECPHEDTVHLIDFVGFWVLMVILFIVAAVRLLQRKQLTCMISATSSQHLVLLNLHQSLSMWRDQALCQTSKTLCKWCYSCQKHRRLHMLILLDFFNISRIYSSFVLTNATLGLCSAYSFEPTSEVDFMKVT